MNVQGLIEEIDRETAGEALWLLCDHESWRRSPFTDPVPVDPARVLYRTWNPGRLERALRIYREQGTQFPPVRLIEMQIGEESWYYVSDGNHRSAAAHQLGHVEIHADVTEIHPVTPGVFCLDEAGNLWRRVDNVRWRQEVCRDNPDLWRAWIRLGVQASPALRRKLEAVAEPNY